MGRLLPGWRLRRTAGPLTLRPGVSAGRASPDEEEGAAGAPPPGGPPSPPPPPPAPAAAPSQQKLVLYASGALVVLIVVVIIALGSRPTRDPLAYVPVGHSQVQVVDLRRFAPGPVFRILSSANHPVAQKLEQLEEDWRFGLRRDIDHAVDTDDLTILLGRLRPARLRAAFEAIVEHKDRQLAGAEGERLLEVVERQVDGRDYLECCPVHPAGLDEEEKEGLQMAFASVRSSVACFGDTGLAVRRFLRVRAGLRDAALDDELFAAAYDPRLARRAFLYRLEKPGGPIGKRLLGDGAADLRSAFFALTSSEAAIGLTIRLVAGDEEAAERLTTTLTRGDAQRALAEAVGPGAEPAVSREGSVVVIEASLDLAAFETIVLAEQAAAKGRKLVPQSLITALLAA